MVTDKEYRKKIGSNTIEIAWQWDPINMVLFETSICIKLNSIEKVDKGA